MARKRTRVECGPMGGGHFGVAGDALVARFVQKAPMCNIWLIYDSFFLIGKGLS